MMKARAVFENLVPLFVEAIPKTIVALEITEPLCCVRICYYDTHAPCTYLLLKTVSEHDRTRMLADKGSKALECLWASYEGSGHGPSVYLGEPDTRTPIAKLFRRVYRLLGKDEDKYMRIFRETLQRVSRELNSKDWSQVFPVTDDFVFVPADGSQFFCDEFDDLVNSIPAEQLELLRSRGLLGPGRQWEQRPGYQYSDGGLDDMFRIKQEIEEQILRLQLADQVRYWVNQLDKMAAVKDCDMTRIEADSGSPFRDLVEQVLDRLGQIGSDSVVPMLKLACEWADKPERDDQGKLTGVFNVFVTLLRKVCKLGYANREIELMLRDFLEKSCRANEGRLLWGLMPFHCAKCLHELFERYPEPEIGNNTLTNRDQFLRPPLP